MSEKRTLRRKIVKYVFTLIQYAFVILWMISVIGIISGAASIFLSGFQDLSGLSLVGSSLFWFFVCIFVVGILERKVLSKIRPTPTPLSLKETLMQIGYGAGAIIAIIILFQAINEYFKSFPATMNAGLALEILKVIIQTNGVLIGFSGIVFAQMFWAIHHQQSTIQTNILEDEAKSEQTNEKKTLNHSKDFLEALESKRSSMIFTMCIVIAFFILSIYSCLSGMAQTEILSNSVVPTIPYITNPFYFMTFGIAFFIVFIIRSKMSVKDELEEIKKKKAKKPSHT